MNDTKTYPLSAITGDEKTDKNRIAELTDALNRVCDENRDFVAESIKDEARIVALEAENARLKAALDRYSEDEMLKGNLHPPADAGMVRVPVEPNEGMMMAILNRGLGDPPDPAWIKMAKSRWAYLLKAAKGAQEALAQIEGKK